MEIGIATLIVLSPMMSISVAFGATFRLLLQRAGSASGQSLVLAVLQTIGSALDHRNRAITRRATVTPTDI